MTEKSEIFNDSLKLQKTILRQYGTKYLKENKENFIGSKTWISALL